MLAHDDRHMLLAIARETIEQAVYRSETLNSGNTPSQSLLETRASFVTLKLDSMLRGCIGTLEAVRPLYDDVIHNALAAAFHDPRFPPLSATETPQLQIEISVLGRPEPLDVRDRSELLRLLQPGLDGLIVEAGLRRATFLPSVWDTLAEADEFVTHLWIKAGLTPDAWPEGIHLLRYSAEHFDEHNPGHGQ